MFKNNISVSFMNIWLPLYYASTSWFGRAKISKQDRLNVKGKTIVSLTTTPSRIHKTWMVVESILRQNDKPDALLLYLSAQEFKGKKQLPAQLVKQQERGLQIIFVKENLRPHNKYMYAMENFPNALIVTIDDDKIYPSDLIANLKKYHELYPHAICAVMARKIRYHENAIMPYSSWDILKVNAGPQQDLMSLGVSGVLFPPHCLHADVFDKATLKEKALLTDDLWIKVMALRNHTPIVSLAGCYTKPFISVKSLAMEQLRLINIAKRNNDLVFKDLMRSYNIDEKMILNKP